MNPMSATDITVMQDIRSFIVLKAQRCQSKAFCSTDNVRHLALSNTLM
jgi:hypothetical protein